MTTLVGNVNSTSEGPWTVSEDILDSTDYLQIDNEVVRVKANFHSSIYAPTGEITPAKIRAERGAGGTTAASHTNGATLTPVIPPATGGGGGGAAADITFTPNGSIAATDVQAAVQEVRDEAGAGVLLSATVDLDAADIATLSSVPVEVVSAPGAGKVIVPIRAGLEFTPGSVAFGDNPSPLLAVGGVEVLDLPEAGFNALDPTLGFGAAISTGNLVPDDSANVPLMLTADLDPIGLGPILAASVGEGGSGYAPGDTGTIGESGGATYEVDTVDGGGAVTAFTITAPGTGYFVTDGASTAVTTGAGDGAFTVNIDSITLASDGTARLQVLYYVMDLA